MSWMQSEIMETFFGIRDHDFSFNTMFTTSAAYYDFLQKIKQGSSRQDTKAQPLTSTWSTGTEGGGAFMGK